MWIAWLAVATWLAAGCATGGGPGVGTGPVSPQLEQRAADETAPTRPLRVRFEWELRERDARFDGQGVARIEPPFRARLDLFGPRGSGLLTAVLVDDVLDVPAASEIAVPPAPLLWSVIGVVRPPERAMLTTAVRDGDAVRLEYAAAGDRWSFIIEEGALRRAEWQPDDGARHTVELDGAGPDGVPERAVYRDYGEFRELSLRLERADEVDGFPADIWTIGGP